MIKSTYTILNFPLDILIVQVVSRSSTSYLVKHFLWFTIYMIKSDLKKIYFHHISIKDH